MKEENKTITYQEEDFTFSLHYRKKSQDLLMFIHGLGYSKEDYNSAWEHTDFDTYSLLAIDLIGFGKSSRPSDYSYAIEEQAELCKLLLEEFPEERIHIVAHSVGGGIGVLLAERILAKLASVVSIEGNLIGEDCGLITRKTSSVSFEEFETQEFPARFERLRNRGESTYGHRHSSPQAFYKMAESIVRWSDTRKLLSTFLNLPVPKAYFYGDRNKQMPVIRELTSATLYEIPDSGHLPMSENTQEFYRKLSTFYFQEIKTVKEAET